MNEIKELFENFNFLQLSIPLVFLFGCGCYQFMKWKRSKPKDPLLYDSSSASSMNDSDDDYKLVLIVRNELKMGKGKVAAQCAHAAVSAYKKALKYPKLLKHWENYGQTKITLKCNTEEELMKLHKSAKMVGLLSNIVCDAGQTQVLPGSKTVCGIGPGPSSTIDELTGHLKLY